MALESHIRINIQDIDYDCSIRGCPLCRRYYNEGCMNCPISIHTGYEKCIRTPYTKVPHGDHFVHPKQILRIGAEIDFLVSLLPAKEQKRWTT
jgi:hypothetical protein